jgi:hypothetical protein
MITSLYTLSSFFVQFFVNIFCKQNKEIRDIKIQKLYLPTIIIEMYVALTNISIFERNNAISLQLWFWSL